MKETIKICCISLLMAALMHPRGMMAQEKDCRGVYLDARLLYEAGRIDTAYRLLMTCIEADKGMRTLDKGEQGRIYRLAADAASFLGYDAAALDHTMAFREVQPHSKVREDDMPEFKANMDKIRIHPKNILSLMIMGPNTSPVMLRNLCPFTAQGEYESRDDDFLIGFQYKRFIHPNIALGIGMQYGTALKLNMIGSSLPLKGRWKYHLGISSLEWPLIGDYNIYITEKIFMYVEAGFSYRLLFRSGIPYGPYFTKEHSEDFGRYYSVSAEDPENPSPLTSVAYFFESPLEYNFICGLGASFRFEDLVLEIGIRYFPRLVQNDPFRDVVYFDDIPESDPLHYYDDIFFVRVKNHFQMTIGIGIPLGYKAY